MSAGERRIDGLRAVAERVAGRAAGRVGIARLRAVLETFDRAGGGLVAAGLAYTSLLAVLPGLLLGLSALGWLVRAEADREQIVALIAQALPPLKDVARVAFDEVSAGAGPTSVLAIVTLLWGSSRLYANLDTALSRIFSGAPRRNAVAQTVRGVGLVAVLVVLPAALVATGSVVTWATQFAPTWLNAPAVLEVGLEAASPLGSLLAFVAAVAMCYRFVPSERVPWAALRLPAGAIGLTIAVFTQLYAFLAPRLVGVAAVYGTFVAAFALLAWLSVAFNLLLLGAAWTDVRMRNGSATGVTLPGPGHTPEHLRAAEDEPADGASGEARA